jgi:hypothetical protein
MVDDLAVEMLALIHDDLAKRGERQRYADLVQILREQLPDVYKDNDLHYLSLCLQDALVDGRRDAVSSLARELALDGGRDIDLLHQAFDGLAYHGCLPVLVEAHRTAWASVKDSAEIFEWAISDFANAAADCEILDYLEHTTSPNASDPALLDRVKFFVEEPRLEYLNEFIADLTGQEGREWTVDDFSLKRRKKGRGNANLPGVGADNLSRLIRQFVGYLRRDEGVSFATGAMVRPDLFGYFLERHDGELKPRLSMFDEVLHPHRKPPKPAPPIHPLCPERTTFDVYLGRLVVGFSNLFYQSAALFQAVPPWLRFLQSQRLIDEQTRGRVVHDLLPLHARILDLFEHFTNDPTVYQALQRWPEDAARNAQPPQRQPSTSSV